MAPLRLYVAVDNFPPTDALIFIAVPAFERIVTVGYRYAPVEAIEYIGVAVAVV